MKKYILILMVVLFAGCGESQSKGVYKFLGHHLCGSVEEWKGVFLDNGCECNWDEPDSSTYPPFTIYRFNIGKYNGTICFEDNELKEVHFRNYLGSESEFYGLLKAFEIMLGSPTFEKCGAYLWTNENESCYTKFDSEHDYIDVSAKREE